MTTRPLPIKAPQDEMVPRALVFAMFGLTLSVLTIVAVARLTDQPLSATPPVEEIIVSRTVILGGDLSGAATVTTLDGETIANLTPEKGGFIAGVHRVVLRERVKHRVAADAPVVLDRTASGRIRITDPSTGWSADLMGFGVDNARAFARLLPQP